MERRLNFEEMISHLFPKAKQPNDQTRKDFDPNKTVRDVALIFIFVVNGEHGDSLK